MLEKLEITRMAQALAAHAGARQGAIAQNVANADTPGYRALDLPSFAATYESQDQSTALRATRPGHLHTPEQSMELVFRQEAGGAAPNGNTVSLENQMVRAAEVKQQHDMALAIYSSTSAILRSSLGRNQ